MTKAQIADWVARLEQLYTELNHERADDGAELKWMGRENDIALDYAMKDIHGVINLLQTIEVEQ